MTGGTSEAAADHARRFGGVARLYGAEALPRLAAAHVAVVGVGGVGSWAVEALARSAVGRLTLIDLDMIAESNVNRQIHALGDAFGQAKVSALHARVLAINPQCVVHEIEDFVTPENVATLLGGGIDLIIDAIDQVRTKAAMIAWAHRARRPILTAGAAGGQFDPTRIRCDDLARTEQDPLLAKVRARLRRDYGFPREAGRKFGVPAVYSTEPLRAPRQEAGAACGTDEAPRAGGGGLNCAGYGSSVCVTAGFGLTLAAEALRRLLGHR